LPSRKDPSLALWFDEVDREDKSLVSGKNANVGEMIRKTSVPVPSAFAVTAYAYQLEIEKTGLQGSLRQQPECLDAHGVSELQKKRRPIKRTIEKSYSQASWNKRISPKLENKKEIDPKSGTSERDKW